MINHKIAIALMLAVAANGMCSAGESFPPLKDGKAPQNLVELWGGYEPRSEPLQTEILKEWEEEGVVCRVVRYQVGIFKGAPAKVAAFYAFPKGAAKSPGLVQIHGGGQSASFDAVFTEARRGYACISINWGGNKLNFGRSQMVYAGPQTDWGNLDATHPPQRNKVNHFAGSLAPDAFTLDSVESPRNSNWFIVLIAARRAITFLEQQPEIDPVRIGVCGHSMGGKLTTDLAGIDSRVKCAVPSCGGAGDILESQSELPGCVKRKLSALVLACESDNAYIPRIVCPVLWLSPTNDFNAPIDNMAWNWRNLPDRQCRFSISAHLNHRHVDEHSIDQHLWFEQNLKGSMTVPMTPRIDLCLRGENGAPLVTVTPDSSIPVKRVDIYYSIDPHPLSRFWRDANGVKEGGCWKAGCPLISRDRPLFAYANVIYDTPAKYRNLAQAPGCGNTDTFAISSRVLSASPSQLRAAGAAATDQPERMIDDGTRGWHDWYRLNWDHAPLWRAVTRKLKDDKWRGPDGAKLVFEVRPKADSTLVIDFNTNAWGAFNPGKPAIDYTVVKELKGSGEWQRVSVALDELVSTDPKNSAPLANWQTVTELSIGPSGETMKDGRVAKFEGKPWLGPKEIRNMRWEGGNYTVLQVRGSNLSVEEHQKQFNDAIKKSLEQESVDRKAK